MRIVPVRLKLTRSLTSFHLVEAKLSMGDNKRMCHRCATWEKNKTRSFKVIIYTVYMSKCTSKIAVVTLRSYCFKILT